MAARRTGPKGLQHRISPERLEARFEAARAEAVVLDRVVERGAVLGNLRAAIREVLPDAAPEATARGVQRSGRRGGWTRGSPTRQWVLTVPWKRRWLLARNPDLALGVLRIAIGRIERWYRRETGSNEGQGGAVTVIQRFGSSLALNLHFHILALDGVYVTGADGRPSFRQATPHLPDVEALVEEIWRAAERWLRRQGHPADDDTEPDAEDASALLQQASLEGLEAVGPRAGQRVRRTQRLGGREVTLPPRCASCEGYNLHAGVSVRGTDRDALERLLRYTLRAPLAKGRLSEAPDGTVVLELKRAWSDGTSQVSFSRADFVGKLAALVPPPRSNQTVYHGVLAGNAVMRDAVVPPAPERTEAEQAARKARKLTREPTRDTPGWADLLLRVFGEDVLVCRHCRGPLTLRAVVVHPPATTRILERSGDPDPERG